MTPSVIIPHAPNRQALVDALRGFDISVPRRRKERRHEHGERWMMCRWLASLAVHDSLGYPLTVTHRDRPDFELKMAETRMGVECTEAIPTDLAHVSALVEDKENSPLLHLSHFKWGEEKTKEERAALVSGTAPRAPGWVGDEVELEWAQAVSDIIRKKTVSLQSNEFEKYEENVLLIYDNLPSVALDHEKAAGFLLRTMADYWQSESQFTSAYVLSEEILVHLLLPGFRALPTKDLWSGVQGS